MTQSNEGDIEGFMEEVGENITHALKLKSTMKCKGLREARCKCNRCGNETLQGRIVGHNGHGRFWCSTEGCTFTRMME